MKYKPSKKLKPGMLCSIHGQWLVPAGGKRKVVGVWQGAINGLMRTPNGELLRFDVPCGLVVQGNCSVALAK